MQENAPKPKSKAEIEAEIAANNEKIEAAQMSFDGVEQGNLEAANEALKKELESLAENLPSSEMNPAESSQVENMGGNKEAVEEVTAGVDAKIAEKEGEIKNVESEAEQKEIQDLINSCIEDAQAGSGQAAFNLHRWVERAVRKNIPFDQEKVKAILDAEIAKGDLTSEYSFENMELSIKNTDLGRALEKAVEEGNTEDFEKAASEYDETNEKLDRKDSYVEALRSKLQPKK